MEDVNDTVDIPIPLLFERGFLGAPECARIRHAMDSGTDDPAEIVGDTMETREAIRRTRSIDIDAAVRE
jgi:hypothetical protein